MTALCLGATRTLYSGDPSPHSKNIPYMRKESAHERAAQVSVAMVTKKTRRSDLAAQPTDPEPFS